MTVKWLELYSSSVPVHCYAFAPPCVLSPEASTELKPNVTSVVYGLDMVCRFGLNTSLELRDALFRLNDLDQSPELKEEVFLWSSVAHHEDEKIPLHDHAVVSSSSVGSVSSVSGSNGNGNNGSHHVSDNVIETTTNSPHHHHADQDLTASAVASCSSASLASASTTTPHLAHTHRSFHSRASSSHPLHHIKQQVPQREKMFPVGTVYWLSACDRKEELHARPTVILTDGLHFDELLVAEGMFSQHMPQAYAHVVECLFRPEN